MADVNILSNGKLNLGFTPYEGDESKLIPIGWAPWWVSSPADKEGEAWAYQTPTFDQFEIDEEPVCRVQTPFGTHVGGLYQQIPVVTGEKYDFSIQVQAWSSESEGESRARNPADIKLQIGVDPTGGTDGESPLIKWSKSVQAISKWRTLRMAVSSQHAIITLFVRSMPDMPKRHQAVYWKDASLSPVGRYKRATNIVGPGDTHILLEPERPQPGTETTIQVSSLYPQELTTLTIQGPQKKGEEFEVGEQGQQDDRYFWHYTFTPVDEGLYDFRFLVDNQSRLLSQRLIRIAKAVQIVPSGRPRIDYGRVYVLLPPTADERWLVAAAKGGFEGRFTIGFSADDAGAGEVLDRKIIGVNPHHWPETLTSAWYQQHYPGCVFIPIVANSPEDLEKWLRDWHYE
ncbi:MAG: hypothetical protein AAF633_18685 [Chloroflexota bacterium]